MLRRSILRTEEALAGGRTRLPRNRAGRRCYGILLALLHPFLRIVSRLRHILAMAARSACQSFSLLNEITFPGVEFRSSITNLSFLRDCKVASLCLQVTAQALESRKAMILDNQIFQDKRMDDLKALSKQSAQSNTPNAAAPISVVATKVETLPLERLKNGYLKFKEKYMKDEALVKKLAEGQQPAYMIIACADSRVDPCTVLSLGPGEAFVLRNIGNILPPYTASSCSSAGAAMEFAVLHLKVKHLVVIGHSRCGAVRALMNIEEDGSNRFSEFIEDWVLISKGASKKVKNIHQSAAFQDQCASCEKEVVNYSLWNCLSYPFVREKVILGDLTLHGGYYDFVNSAFESWSLDVSSISKVEKVQ